MNPPPPTASLWGKHHHRHRAETNIIHYYPWNGHSLYTLYLLYMYVYIYVYIYIYTAEGEDLPYDTSRAHDLRDVSGQAFTKLSSHFHHRLPYVLGGRGGEGACGKTSDPKQHSIIRNCPNKTFATAAQRDDVVGNFPASSSSQAGRFVTGELEPHLIYHHHSLATSDANGKAPPQSHPDRHAPNAQNMTHIHTHTHTHTHIHTNTHTHTHTHTHTKHTLEYREDVWSRNF
jgi:hypothetical protein